MRKCLRAAQNLFFASRSFFIVECAAFAGLMFVFFAITPDFFTGIGYAFCHQIPARSPVYQFFHAPFCYRCLGLFCGFFVSALNALFSSPIPFHRLSKWMLIPTILIPSFYVFDPLNATFFKLYQDYPLLRVISGLLMGNYLGIIAIALFSFSFFSSYANFPEIKRKPLFFLRTLLINLAFLLLIFAKSATLQATAAVTSIIAVLTLNTILYSILVLVFTRLYQQFSSLAQGKNILLFGLILTFSQIILVDLLRFHLTGFWLW